MTRRAVLPFLVLLLAGTAIVSGCAGDEEPARKADPAADNTNTAGKPDSSASKPETAGAEAQDRGTKIPRESRAEKERRIKADAKQADRELKQLEEDDREFDKEFKQTRFDKLIAKLPIRKPPLFVEQYITTDDSHTVHTAVDRKRFLCRLNAGQRKRAVEDFYRAADKVFRAGGVKDFEQVVTPLSETTEQLPALATARKGSVSLTARGRSRGPC